MLLERLKFASITGDRKGGPALWLPLLLAFVFAVAALALWMYVDKRYFSGKDSLAWRKNTVTVARGSIDLRISATGVIRPYNQVKISPKYTGLLKRLLVKQGDMVKAGELIALMDDSNLLGQVQAAQSAYFAARANYEKALHGNRPQEVLASAALLRRADSQVKHAEQAVERAKAQVNSVSAEAERDETNARRLTDLALQGAISDQERLNAVTQAQMSKARLQQSQQELKQAEASLHQSRAELEAARQQLSLMKAGFRKEDVEAAREAMLQAEGNLKFLQSQLNDTRIRAPFDGVVTQKYTDEGAIVTPTTSAATTSATSSSIVSLAGRLELVAQVSETDIDNISVGQAVEIVANAYPDRVFHGTVNLIAPEAIVTANVTTFEVHATIDDDRQHRLMSGMNVAAQFLAGKKDGVLLIPTACIISKHGKTGVLAPDTSGNPEFKPIKTGATSGTQTVVAEGLAEGESVFVGLSRAQLEELGYAEALKMPGSTGSSGRGHPGIPRGFGKTR